MKTIKKNALWLIAQFFIFIVPVILLIILACDSNGSGHEFKLWGVIALVVITIVYYFVGKKELNKKKEKDYDKKGYVPVWIRVLGLIVVMLPFVAFILLLQCFQDMTTEIMTFIGCTMGSVGIGYILLIVDSAKRQKELESEEEKE